MTPLFLTLAAANLGGFIYRAHRWARTGSGYSAFVAGAHLLMALLLGSAALTLWRCS